MPPEKLEKFLSTLTFFPAKSIYKTNILKLKKMLFSFLQYDFIIDLIIDIKS